jgi:uncharacterized membrane protein
MANALQDNLRVVLSRAVEEAARSASVKGRSVTSGKLGQSDGLLSGMRGLAVGAGAAALAPVAVKGAGKLAKRAAMNGLSDIATKPAKGLSDIATKPAKGLSDIATKPAKGLSDIASKPAQAVEKLGSGVGSAIGDKLSRKVDESGGASGILKDAAKSALPFSGGDKSKGESGAPGVGKGRRMPIQQSVDIGLPVETVYNQWTQFEEWPNFMHRVTRVSQEDDCTVKFAAKIWGKTKEFTAKIETQRPDERIKWSVTDGMTHTGVVTFHELGPKLTRVLLGFDLEPGGMIEKLARGARHVKRAARADLHRFKAFIEMQERESGAWRGVIEDGELVKEHDPSYDEEREYFESDSKRGEKRRAGGSRQRGSGQGRSQRSRSSSGRSQASSRSSQGSSRRSQGSSSRSGGSSSRGGGSSSRGGGSSSRSRGSGTGQARSSSRSSSARSRADSSGSPRSATRSRTQASRSNGRG